MPVARCRRSVTGSSGRRRSARAAAPRACGRRPRRGRRCRRSAAPGRGTAGRACRPRAPSSPLPCRRSPRAVALPAAWPPGPGAPRRRRYSPRRPGRGRSRNRSFRGAVRPHETVVDLLEGLAAVTVTSDIELPQAGVFSLARGHDLAHLVLRLVGREQAPRVVARRGIRVVEPIAPS